MSEAVAPALTREGWENRPWVCGWTDGTVFVSSNRPLGDELAEQVERPHAVAALCLFEQPFGFTRGDVELVRDCIGMEWDRGERGEMDALEKRLESLAARIAALLPPEAS
jgi:hypothetical protein